MLLIAQEFDKAYNLEFEGGGRTNKNTINNELSENVAHNISVTIF